jgi:hypothetical protein
MTVAIIGTAGRDKAITMTLPLWKWSLRDVYARVHKGAHVVSGGAAWMDHLAVSLFLFGHAGEITLHLPAPFEDGKFVGGWKSAGGIANYYHGLFSKIIERDTLGQIAELIHRSATEPNIHITFEPASEGMGGMFARNAKVAKADEMLAYTFGAGDVPADGGTKNTWDKFTGPKTHISLPLPLYL